VTTLTALTSSDVPETQRGGAAADRAFRLHCLNRDSTNGALLKYRDWQGYMVTGQHSGTHWIKWMLSHAIAAQYGVEPPRYFNNASSNEIIGHPKHRRVHGDLPRIASSHSIPPYALDRRWVRALLPVPPYGVVVRNIRDVMISNYEKWRGTDRKTYDVPFSRYVAGDPTGKAYVCDVWWYVHFLNRWGEVASRFPAETLVIRYEDFQADRRAALERLARHLGLTLSAAALDAGAAAGAKDVMAGHQDPNIDEKPLRMDGVKAATFSDADEAMLRGILDRNLRHDFGYGYLGAPRGFQA